MRFADLDVSDLAAAMAGRGFDYVGKGRNKGWLKFVGKLRADGKHHACEVEIWQSFDRLPLIWMTHLPPDLPALRPHLSPSGYLCYIAHDAAVVDPFDPIGQTLGALLRAEEVLNAILKGEMIEDLADEFYVHWGGRECLVDVQRVEPGNEEAFELDVAGRAFLVVTDDQVRTTLKMKMLLGGETHKKKVPVVRVATSARPVPYQTNWPPKTMRELLKWQLTLDPTCASAIERKMLTLVREGVMNIVVIIESPQLQYGFHVTILHLPKRRNKPVPFREPLLRHAVDRLSVLRIDDRYIAERNLPAGKTLAGLRIALVGCGTIGGYLADMLVKAGAGTSNGHLILIDMDALGPQNLGRHRLGFRNLFGNKAKQLEAELRHMSPGVSIESKPYNVKAVQLARVDLLIDATGEQSLSDWLAWKYVNETVMLTAWVEGPGSAVTALLKARPEHACIRCISRSPQSNDLRIFEDPPSQLLRGHGCEGLYVPFPASASIQAAALAMEMVQAWVNDMPTPTMRTRVLHTNLVQRTGDCSPLKVDGCPACSS